MTLPLAGVFARLGATGLQGNAQFSLSGGVERIERLEEITELCDKRHDNVLRDTMHMLNEVEIAALSFEGSYLGADGTRRPCFHLPKKLTLTLVSGYNVQLRKRIIDRWMELEAERAPFDPAQQPRDDARPASQLHREGAGLGVRGGLDA
jgi:hypothetical protein